MQRMSRSVSWVAAVVLCSGVWLRGDSPQVPSGTWAPIGDIADARAGASAALLPDGRILVTGGSGTNGPLASVEILDGTGSFSVAAPMSVSRTKHSSVTLKDGRVLVIGGRTASGESASAEVYDPASNAWSPVGSMAEARSGHTASLLSDGRVLVAGGKASGAARSSLEIFDALSDTFSWAGSLSTPRIDHAAAVLSDGRVLIVGGSGGTNPLASTDLYDPASSSVSSGPSLSVARAGASATTLLDGNVLVAGGSDGSLDLFSGEVYAAAADSFSVAPGTLTVARRDHLAFLLPHNNNVLIVGGTSNGAALDSAELFIPWQGAFEPTGSLFAARVGSTGSALRPDGLLAVVGGGGVASSELYGFATVKTDKDDYAPGETVTITGSGWEPGERVTLVLHEDLDPPIHGDRTLVAVAGISGAIFNDKFAPEEHDLGVKFYLTATGSRSEARTTFTDSRTINSVTLDGGTSVTVQPGASITAVISATTDNGGGNQNWRSTGWRINTTSPGTVTCVDHANHDGAGTYSETFSITAPASAGTYNAYFIAYQNDICSTGASNTFTLTNGVTVKNNQTITFGPLGNKIYGDADFSVSASASSGLPVTFTGAGNCTVSGSTVHISGAGSCDVTAHQAGDGTYNPAPDVTQSFTITQKAASVTPNAASKTYGNADPALTGTLSGFMAGDGVTATYSRTAGETVAGSPYTISATLSPAGVLGNYNITYNTGSFTISQRDASVTPNAASKTYGDADPTLTGSLSGFVVADGVSATYARTAGEMVAGSPYTISAALSPAGVLGNYNITYNTASFTISQRDASVTPNAASKTYGDADPTLTGTLSGFVVADGVTATYARTAGETVAGSPYTISAMLSPAGVLGNYNITYNTASFTISQRAASVTPNAASKTYGDSDPALTGTLTNFVAGDGVTATYSRTAGETVAGSPFTISATLSPAGVLGNYNITYNTASFTISQRAASVTPNAASKTYGDSDPALTGTLTNFVAGDGVTATYARTAGETVAGSPYTISATLSPAGTLGNYNITYNTASFTTTKATLTVTADNKSKLLNAPLPTFTPTYSGFKNGETLATSGVSGAPSLTTTATQTSPVGSYSIAAALGTLSAGNYSFVFVNGTLTVAYASGGACLGEPGHQILQPINADGTSVFKQKSTVPAKFRVCDGNGASIGTAGVVSSFRLIQVSAGTASDVDEAVVSTTPDTQFRWDPTAQQWIFNINTKPLSANTTYIYRITLNDSSLIDFLFGLK